MKYLTTLVILSLCLPFLHFVQGQVWAQVENHVLSLDGEGDYVEIKDSENLNAINSQVTMEAWIKATAFPNQWMPIIYKGDKDTPRESGRSYTLWLNRNGYLGIGSKPSGTGQVWLESTNGSIALNTWYHIAGVIDANGGIMKIFINGTEVTNGVFGEDIRSSSLPLRIGGWTHEEDPTYSPFAGQIDEVRIWNVARTGKQIVANMFQSLIGNELGLVAYWRFEGEEETVIDATENGNDGQLVGDATRIVSELPTREELHQSYLSSLKLELSVRRLKPSELSDVLAITVHQVPKSSIWTAPQITVPVEIRDEDGKLLKTLKIRTAETVDWAVPKQVQGEVTLLAQYTDATGLTQRAEFTCQAHSTIPVTKKMGHFQTYDVTDGLGGSTVYAILQDRNGFLWFGLAGGRVSRYDGHTFRIFTPEDGLPASSVCCILEDSAGNLWFGTNEPDTRKGAGVCKYDGVTFKTYTTADGLADNTVTAIYEDYQGHLWFGTMNGVSEFDGVTFRNYTPEDGFPSDPSVLERLGDERSVLVEAITQDHEGNLWFGHGTRSAGIGYGATRYDGKSYQTFTSTFTGAGVVAIVADKQGNLWFGVTGASGRLSKYDGKSFVNFTTEDGLCGKWVLDVYQTESGDLWIATGNDGVSRYRNGSFESFSANDGLAVDGVQCITEDREGNLWFGTGGGGASRYDDSVINIAIGIGATKPIMDSSGNLWFKNSERPCRYDGENIRTFDVADGVKFDRIKDFCEDRNGNIWISGWQCLVRYDGEQCQTFTTKDGIPGVWIEKICEDSKGLLWIGVQARGLCTYDGDKFVQVADEEEIGRGWRFIEPITEDSRGNIWFRKWGYGVCWYDGEKFTDFTAGSDFPSDSIWDVMEDRSGRLWMGGRAGLGLYDGKDFQVFTIKDGLAENTTGSIFEDHEGSLWFCTLTGGVQKFDGQNFQVFTTDDGLLKNLTAGILEDEAGNMIFATERGITIYTPPKEKIPPPVLVTEVVADKLYTKPTELRIPSTVSYLSFAYYGVSFKTSRMRYNYMLEGYDTDWRATWDEQVSYENLKPGDYTFKVIAINRDLVYSETPATVRLTIAIPWYLNGWIVFPSLGVFSVMLFVAFYFGKRLQTQRAIAQQFNPYIAGRVVGSDLFYGRSDLITDIERTLANNCFLLYGERRIGKTSLQHQLRERLQNADDPTYRFIPAYIDLQGVAEEDFFRTIAASVVEHAASSFKETLPLRLNEDRDRYTYRDLNRDLRTILDHLKENKTRTIKLVLLMDEVDTLNAYSLRANLNLRGLFMGPLKENLVLVMSGLYLKTDWSDEGAGSPPFNFLSREIQLEPLNQEDSRKLITEPVRGFYSYEPKSVDLIIELSELRPFTIQACCLRAVNRILQDGRTRITVDDIEAIKESVLAEVQSIRGERAGTSLPGSLNEALVRLADLEAENKRLREEAA
ncbi:hypothetical protein H8D98_00580 [bacterium]|nr:hypothetical protein [bacterium]